MTDDRENDTIGHDMIITELQPHDSSIAWSGLFFGESTAIPVSDFERPAPEHDKPNATSIDTPLSSSPTEWNSHELARLHREGHPDAAYLNAAYYDVFDGQAPDGSGPVEYVAYKPLLPDVYAIKAARDRAYDDLDPGQKAMAHGNLIGGIFLGVSKSAEGLTRGIKNPTLRTIARRSIEVLGYGSLIGGAVGCLGRSVAPPVAPTLPPPGGETSMPPTPHFPPEASSVISAPVEMVAALPDALPEPGKPQVVAGLSSVMPGQGDVISLAPLDNRIALALNEQGVKPFFGKDDNGDSIFSADVSVDGKKACLPAAPEQIANKNDPLQVFNYIPDGSASPMVGFGSPDLLGEAGDSHNVIRYGATTNGQTDIAGILSPALPSLENTDCAYGSVINADITPNPNDFNGAVVGVHYDPETGEIKAYNSPVLVDPNEARINVQSNGQILLDGQPMESRVWVGNATATPIPTFTPAPTFTPEPSATPDLVASFEVPADHAPWWAYDGGISVITTRQNGQDFALYSAIFQSYLVNQRVETINGADEIVATAVYQTPDGAQRSVDVVFDKFVKYYDLQARKPLEGRGDTIISREKLQLDIDNWIKEEQQIPLSVIVGYGGVPDSVKNRDCTERCSTIDNVLLTMSPDDLLNFYSNSGTPTDNKPIRLVVLTVNIGPNDLWSAGSISNFPEKQIRQFPFKP